jgi:general secretion pathway protein M
MLMRARRAVQAAWTERSGRERQALALAGTVLGAYLLWAVALAPALGTLRQAPARIAALERQLQQMQALAAEAQALRATPPLATAQAQALLSTAAARLGDKARLMLQGDRAVLTLNGLDGAQLAIWLAEVRAAARVRVIEAQLSRTPQGGYTGSVVLAFSGQR